MSKYIDLSVMIEDNPGEPLPIKIKKTTNAEGAETFGRKLIFSKKNSLFKNIHSAINYITGKKGLYKRDFPMQEFLSLEMITLSSHTGTHMDAPSHFGTVCEGKPARTIDQIPLDWFFSDGVVLNMTFKKGGELITVNDVENELIRISYTLKPKDIVLIYTGVDKKWGTPAYFFDAPGMSRQATEYLIDRGIKVMGIDAYGFDRPIMAMVKDFFKTKDNKHLWPAHFLGRDKEYFHMERLCNLDKIPYPCGFKVSCFPVKMKDCGASWVRAVAIVDE